MNHLNNVCFICLNGKTKLKAVLQNGTQNETIIQIKCVLPELTIFDSVYICSICCTSINSFYTFKKKCLQNYNDLMNKSMLQGPSNDQIQIKQEVEDLPHEEQAEPIVVEDLECYQQPEFVKCEITSDYEQNDSSSSDNNSFDPFDMSKQTKICKGLKKFKCLICNNKFTEKGNLQKHMRIHAGIKEFECSICKKQFTLKGHLQRHIKTHTGVKDFECTLCNKKFTQNVSLQMHIKTHDGVKDFECSVCQKRFTLKSYLQKHMRFHVGIRRFECPVCHKRFTLKCHVQAHMKTHMKPHTGVKEIQCLICKKPFLQTCHLKNHMRVHENL